MARYGRFVILTDEHVPYALVEALRKAGWLVYRVEDEPAPGKHWRKRMTPSLPASASSSLEPALGTR